MNKLAKMRIWKRAGRMSHLLVIVITPTATPAAIAIIAVAIAMAASSSLAPCRLHNDSAEQNVFS